MSKKVFICSCGELQHAFAMTFFEDDKDFIYTEVSLVSNKAWYKRVWLALKYVFGYSCKYGHFDEVLLGKEEATQLKEFLEDYLKEN